MNTDPSGRLWIENKIHENKIFEIRWITKESGKIDDKLLKSGREKSNFAVPTRFGEIYSP